MPLKIQAKLSAQPSLCEVSFAKLRVNRMNHKRRLKQPKPNVKAAG
jgi:hypothetical protein